MAILRPSGITGRVTWLGLVKEREESLASAGVESIDATFEGLAGDSHAGLTRKSCNRTKLQYPVGTEIRNTRQISIVSVEELREIAVAMDVPEIRPAWLGANVVLEGIPLLSLIPPSSRLMLEGGASLVIDLENLPCRYPAELLETIYPGKGLKFARHAAGRRGLVAWVERPGAITLRQEATLHVPPQRIYEPAAKPQAKRIRASAGAGLPA